VVPLRGRLEQHTVYCEAELMLFASFSRKRRILLDELVGFYWGPAPKPPWFRFAEDLRRLNLICSINEINSACVHMLPTAYFRPGQINPNIYANLYNRVLSWLFIYAVIFCRGPNLTNNPGSGGSAACPIGPRIDPLCSTISYFWTSCGPV
jgi:hypothetical protein